MLPKIIQRFCKNWAAVTAPWPRFERYARRHMTLSDLRFKRIGSDYGGWVVPTELLSPQSVCYLAGVGEDITFDLGLIEAVGCHVHAFDPTPRAAQHVATVAASVQRFHFHPIGVWSEEATLRFYAPKDPLHVSHSILNLQKTSSYFEARSRAIGDIMRDLGHDRLDLLKLDIEGAEHRVIAAMLQQGIRPMVIAVEFDQPAPFRRMRNTFDRLLLSGYAFMAIDRLNMTFILRQFM